MTHPTRRHLPLAGAYNIRDLGGYRTAAGGTTPWRRFLRADSPHRLAPHALDRLGAEGVTTVLDLRTAHELAEAPNPFAGHDRVTYRNLPLFDDLAPTRMTPAHTPSGDPLLDFYLAALRHRQTAIRDIISAIAGAAEGAVMFHCTAGKDRTGIVAALLLGLADVGRDDIVADYTLTAELIPDLVAEFLDLARSRGRDVVTYARLLETPARTMHDTLGFIEAGYTSVPGYLQAIGVPKGDITALRDRLLAGQTIA